MGTGSGERGCREGSVPVRSLCPGLRPLPGTALQRRDAAACGTDRRLPLRSLAPPTSPPRVCVWERMSM